MSSRWDSITFSTAYHKWYFCSQSPRLCAIHPRRQWFQPSNLYSIILYPVPHLFVLPYALFNMKVSLDFLLGLCLALAAQLLLACADQFYTRAHRTIESRGSVDLRKERSYVCEPYWLLGLVCLVIGFICDMLSFGYAPASLLAPLNSLNLVFNMCLSPIINGEHVSRHIVFSTLIICFGTVVTALFSPRGNEKEGTNLSEELKTTYISQTFAVFSTSMGLLMCSIWAITIRWKDNLKVYSLAIPALSGFMSAMVRTVSKGVAIGLKFTFRGDGLCFTEWLWYVLLVAMLLFSFGHLKWINRGLALFSPLQIVPINMVFGVLGATMAGLLVFHEWDQFTGVHDKLLFPIGIMILISGVVLIHQSPEKEEVTVWKPGSRSDHANKSVESDAKVGSRNPGRKRSLDWTCSKSMFESHVQIEAT